MQNKQTLQKKLLLPDVFLESNRKQFPLFGLYFDEQHKSPFQFRILGQDWPCIIVFLQLQSPRLLLTIMNLRCLMIGVVNALVFQQYQTQIILLIVIEVAPIALIIFMERKQKCFELAAYSTSGIFMGVLMILFNANLLIDNSLTVEIGSDSEQSILTDSINLHIIYVMVLAVCIKIVVSFIPKSKKNNKKKPQQKKKQAQIKKDEIKYDQINDIEILFDPMVHFQNLDKRIYLKNMKNWENLEVIELD